MHYGPYRHSIYDTRKMHYGLYSHVIHYKCNRHYMQYIYTTSDQIDEFIPFITG